MRLGLLGTVLLALITPLIMPPTAGAADAAPAAAAPAAAAPKPSKPAQSAAANKTEDEKTLYTLGVLISRNIDSFQLSAAEFKIVQAGLVDGYNHRATTVDIDAYIPKVQTLQRERVAVLEQREKVAGQAYLDQAAAAPGAQKTQSGLVYIGLSAGTGATPTRSDRVTVNYEGKLIDGTVFDSSLKRGQPATFGLSGVIPCWTEALQLMKVGGKARFVCPATLAYGERGAPPIIKPGATLVFEVELVDIAAQPPEAAAPGAPAGSAPAPGGSPPPSAPPAH
jgi:FKBP-type peptidyl-prolyl cis-trans isomerase